MIVAVLFWLLTLLGCSYAAAFGGRDGRWAVFLIISATLLTIPAMLLGRAWRQTEVGILAVDLLLLVSLYVLCLRSRRYFPIWMTGFHLVAVTTHVSTLLAPEFTPRVYRALESVWAIPITVSMILGIVLDRRAATRAARRTESG
jgi:drug/metabolite transporter superfamily protein YnfA